MRGLVLLISVSFLIAVYLYAFNSVAVGLMDVFERSLFALSSGIGPPPFEESLNNFSWDNQRQYAVIIDAGSSGSRAFIYSWKKSITGSALPKIERGTQDDKNWMLKENNGISSFASNPSMVGSHLQPLLAFAASTIPVRKHASTLLLVFATAGLRLLPSEVQQQLLYEICRYSHENSDFFIGSYDKQCRAISGTAEGLFGWLAVNYLLRSFDQDETIGFIDLGGASSQIAFQNDVKSVHTHKVKLRRANGASVALNVFVATFLGMGMNEAKRRYVEKMQFADNIINDPCLPLHHTANSLYKQTVVQADIRFRGTGDLNLCVAGQRALLNDPCEKCFMDNIPDPRRLPTTFVGVAEFWYTSNDVLSMNGNYDHASLSAKSAPFCSTSVSELESRWKQGAFKSSKNLEDVHDQCFKSAWITNILYDGFHVPKDNGEDVWFRALDEVDGFSLSWTLGVMLLVVSEGVESDCTWSGRICKVAIGAGIAVVCWLMLNRYRNRRRFVTVSSQQYIFNK